MKKVILASTILAMVGSANAESLFESYIPLIGIDYKWTRATIVNDWNHFFAESFPGVSIYGAMKFMENLGVELGYDMTARKGKNTAVRAGDSLGGLTLGNAVGNPSGYHTSLRFAGIHADLIGFLPIDANLELFFTLGVAKVKPTVFVQSLNLSPTDLSNAFNEAMISLRGQHHKVSRIGIGANWAISDSVGFRAKVLWEGMHTLMLKDNVSAGVNQVTVLKPWLKGYSIAFGFFMKY